MIESQQLKEELEVALDRGTWDGSLEGARCLLERTGWELARRVANRALCDVYPHLEAMEIRLVSGNLTSEVAREIASSRSGRLRAPHHTCGEAALMAELAKAAGGTLFLDEAESVGTVKLTRVFSVAAQMVRTVRPILVFGTDRAEIRRKILKVAGAAAATAKETDRDYPV